MDLTTHERKIISVARRISDNEKERASDAGEDRQEIGELLELTGLNKKAFAWARALDKMEPEKRDDVLRSFDPLRDLFQRHWDGQNTPDMLDALAPEPVTTPPEEPEGDDEPGDAEIAEESSEFERELDQLGAGKVVRIGDAA